MDIGQRLRLARESKGYSQIDVGRLLGLTSAAISAYELGKRQPDYETLTKLATLYGYSTDYLLGLSQDPSGRESVAQAQRDITDLHTKVIQLGAARDILLQRVAALDSDDPTRPILIEQLERTTFDLDNARGELEAAKEHLRLSIAEVQRIEEHKGSKGTSPTQDLIYFLRGKELTEEDAQAVKDLLAFRRFQREREERENSQP